MTSSFPLCFRAGPGARRHIERHGLDPQRISAIAGAAGGPKWLVLAGMDKLLFGKWLRERREPLPLVGASIGSWRFAAAAQRDVQAAFDRLEQLYVEQTYSDKPSYRDVTTTAIKLVKELLGPGGARDILEHTWARLHIVTARCKGWSGLDATLPMVAGFGAATLVNTVNRRALSLMLERQVFADPRPGKLPATVFPGFATRLPALTEANLPSALLASGSIPFVMEAVAIEGQAGRYRDGGMVDYHMDLPLGRDGLVLMPHFSRRIVPGWLDKFVPWRKPRYLNNTLVIHPSDEWIASLPNGKIPDRKDFQRYRGEDAARFRDWRMAAERSGELAECLAERLEKQDIEAFLQPL